MAENIRLFKAVSAVLGAVAVFLFGLKLISVNIGKVVSGKFATAVYKATLNRFSAFAIGTAVTSVAQSSVAVNAVLVALAESGAISFSGACAVVIGANVGTTVTAQLVSLSFGAFDVSAAGAIISFFGLILSLAKSKKVSFIGETAFGFGLVFMGISLMTSGISLFYGNETFRAFFLIKNPIVLVMNGFFITAICQSSSVVSSMLVILSAGGLISFENSVFLILGANVGTTVSVIIISSDKSVYGRRVAFFNFLFNLFGAALFFVVILISGGKLLEVLPFSSAESGRAVANFHTFFNLLTGLITLPLLKPMAKLCAFLVASDFKKRGFRHIFNKKRGGSLRLSN